jgi:hypothetical protein
MVLMGPVKMKQQKQLDTDKGRNILYRKRIKDLERTSKKWIKWKGNT